MAAVAPQPCRQILSTSNTEAPMNKTDTQSSGHIEPRTIGSQLSLWPTVLKKMDLRYHRPHTESLLINGKKKKKKNCAKISSERQRKTKEHANLMPQSQITNCHRRGVFSEDFDTNRPGTARRSSCGSSV